MATNQTTNYQLNQWEHTDAVQRVEFNQDNAKLDTALKSLADQVVQKANQSALNTLISAVNQKADASTVSSLSSLLNSEISQRQETDNNFQAALTLKGNCQIYYGTYIGDGKSSRTLTFERRPLLVLIQGGNLICRAIQGNQYMMCRTNGQGGTTCPAIWTGNSLKFNGASDNYAPNSQGGTYYLVTLMAADE